MRAIKSVANLVLVCFLFCSISVFGQVKLPRLISDGMVLQRDTEVKIWGWAAPDEKVNLQFMGSSYKTAANKSGNWEICLSDLKPGGPYKMSISASNKIEIADILIGDVWLCSGQSNMELPMRRVSWIYPDEIANSENNSIRLFKVPQHYDFIAPQEDYDAGSWKSANPENIWDFSAVAYFFAKDIFAKYNVPVGLLNASLGGSPAEAWMSEEALKKFPEHFAEMQRFKDTALIAQIIADDNKRSREWYEELDQKDKGRKNEDWSHEDVNTSKWKTIQMPGSWAGTALEKINGVVWYRRTFEVNSKSDGKTATVILGRIIDADSVFINGVFVGTTGYLYPPRRYQISAGILKKGENTIVIRVINNIDVGGFVLGKSYEIDFGEETIDLQGDWLYRLGATMEPLAGQTFIRWKPGGLYNAMVSPLLNYRIKGAIWYQGESNTDTPIEYREMFPAMINDWRSNWDQNEFPFIFVQLANFMETRQQPSASNWAMMREAQLKTLAVSNTAMAVTIDLGEWNDIHPLNKKDVGHRLSLAAQKVAYADDEIVYSGPVFQSMQVDGNKLILSFSDIGSGLINRGNEDLKQFAIAGADKQFVWATAKIEGNTVVVWNEQIPNPVAVRYGWTDNPEGANLYNKEGLPASPFRTDDWEE